MTKHHSLPAWHALREHRDEFEDVHLADLFDQDPNRFDQFSVAADGVLLDYSKNLVTDKTMSLLLSMAEQTELKAWISKLFAGEPVNNTESRQAMHMALRCTDGSVGDASIQAVVDAELAKMGEFVSNLHAGDCLGCTGKPIRHVVNIGIGGSDLGLVMAAEALADYRVNTVDVRFVSSIDGTHLKDTFAQVDPERTLFIVCSKSFATLETLTNANTAREWMKSKLDHQQMEAKHFVAVSVNLKATQAFGIDDERVFQMWDWVGGRYSLCSSVGLALACAIGMDNFTAMLRGCESMDKHFRSSPVEKNLPIIMGLLAIWYNNFFGAQSHAILPYDNRLHRFPAYLQQLQMESNGKRVDRLGRPLGFDTGQIIWGEPGPNAQHSFYQLLHQGTRLIPADFLAPIKGSGFTRQHQLALAACLAQSRGLLVGQNAEQVKAADGGVSEALVPHRVHPGSRPSNTILFPRLDPHYLGQLIALYEHKVFVESVIWGINPFDQFGVELGKRLAQALEPVLRGDGSGTDLDASTLGLCDFIRKNDT